MPRKERFWDDPKIHVLYAKCLEEIPLWKDVPRSRPKIPPVPKFPINFDELYAVRRELQAGLVCVQRTDPMQEWYIGMNALNNWFEQVSPDNEHPFKADIREILERNGLHFAANDYPYDVPADTIHNVLWYRPRTSRQRRARFLSRMLYMEGLGPEDFMVFRNPPFGKTVPEFPHDHVYMRRGGAGWGVFTTSLLPVEVAMALNDEPGYTIDRAFRNMRKPVIAE